MPDDRICDAVNVFKYSRTGTGRRDIRGDETYKRKYRELARDTLRKLWQLWGADEIGYAGYPYTELWGSSQVNRAGADIQMTRDLQPSLTNYGSTANQAKVAGTSMLVVHEATHMVREAVYVESEVLCRHIETIFYEDLKAGVIYQSKVLGGSATASLAGCTQPVIIGLTSECARQKQLLDSGQMVDHVMHLGNEYRRGLQADFVRRSLHWWGGLGNRWPSTRGYYLAALGDDAEINQNLHPILEILASFTGRAQWQMAKSVIPAQTFQRIVTTLQHTPMLYSMEFTRQVMAAQDATGEYLGIRRSA